MSTQRPSRPKAPASLLVRPLLPFALPILVTFALVLLVGEDWPRQIAPGSGLKLAGLIATGATAYAAWRWAVSGVGHLPMRRFAAVLCAATALMGWPVWTMGVLPSINGAVLGEERAVRMTLDRLEITTKSKSRDFYHWAWLTAHDGDETLASGRYFISEAVYDWWNTSRPASVEVTVAEGLLGARVVTGFE